MPSYQLTVIEAQVLLFQGINEQHLRKLRKLIITRKFAYLFYRKTISAHLPSKCYQFYKMKQLNKYFLEWKHITDYNEEKLRLKIQADLNLKRKFLLHWKNYINNKRKVKFECKLAMVYYLNKLRIRCFIRIKNYRKIYQIEQVLSVTYKNYSIITFLNLHLLNLFLKYYKLQLRYKFIQKWIQETKTRRFCMWLMYTNQRKKLKLNQLKAKCFFERKFHYLIPEYFYNWLKSTRELQYKRQLYHKAFQYLRLRLQKSALKQLNSYRIYRQNKRQFHEQVDEFYTHKLLYKCLKQLESYKNHKLVKNKTRLKVDEFREKQLKRKVLEKLYVNQIKSKHLKHCFLILKQKVEFQIKVGVFLHWDKYIKFKRAKKLKVNTANSLYTKTVMKRAFSHWKNNLRGKKLQEAKFNLLISKFKEKSHLRNLKYHFGKLKLYAMYKKPIRNKKASADLKYMEKLQKKFFNFWLQFIQNKRMKKLRYSLMDVYYRHGITKVAFEKLLRFARSEKKYKSAISDAQQLHKRLLINEALSIILTAGYKRQKEIDDLALEKLQKTFHLAVKYFRKWKWKTLGKSLKFPLIKSGGNDYKLREFDWNPLCFQTPRIPDYLQVQFVDFNLF